MATAKTGSFYLTETVQLSAAQASGVVTQGSIDLGAYVNVPTGQAVAIEEVDFIVQRSAPFGQNFTGMLAANGAISFQLSDLNPGTLLIRADDQSLIASGALNIDFINNIGSETADFYPDSFGPSSLSEAFLVVNDSLFLCGMPSGTTIGADNVFVTVRIKCRVVKLSTKDWMAIAIQSTASDN
ncbi:MAG TPA: hypothetical protein EYN42_00500 [Candidatus Poseidoniales archaeon]|nr:hypothetical protein [Candidatus Poseidoniales archaeon]